MRDKVHAAGTAAIRHAQVFLFADGEINFDRTYLRDRSEDRRRSHQVAHLDSIDAGNSIDQRNHSRVAQVQLSLFDRRLAGLNCCLRTTERLGVGIQLALGNRVSFRFGNLTLHVELGVGHLRLGLGQLPFGLIEHRLKWAWVNLEEDFTLFDECAFVIILANQVTAHLRRNLCVDVAFERSYPLTLNRHVLLNDRRHFDCGRRRRRRGSYPAFAASAQHRHEHKYHEKTEQIPTVAFSSDVQPFKNASGIDPAGSELRSIFGQQAQEPLTTLVDERDFAEIHDANTSHIRAVALLPARLELLYPGVGKQAMQNPSFFGGCFTETDFQHTIILWTC